MATIKSHSDLQQSKKLAEFLPLESADMHYQYVLPKSDKIKHNPEIGNPVNALEWYNKGYTTFGKEPITLNEYCIPCWSLAALLSVLPEPELTQSSDRRWMLRIWDKKRLPLTIGGHVDPVEACYEMILKLHVKQML